MSVPVDDLLGWAASLLTLITFAQTSMIPLRVTAILANVFFIAYSAIGHFLPVLTLHAVLLPLNALRLGRAMTAAVLSSEAAAAAVREDALPPELSARRYIDA